ncbi:uncharacterized protein [Miscanthus floridulus]|uniref:uncharacterized protein isoform X2 n=1 Tax=Miscanthus floridulus TaxID=154761 RepID=UPI0034586A14
MARVSTVALAAAAAALLVSLPAADTYEQETRRMFVEWKAKYRKTYRYAGEEECRYAVFKDSRRRVARSRAAGVTTSGLNSLSASAIEEIYRGRGVRMGEESYEQETRRMFVGWKAKYGNTYRDVGEEECRYRLFKGNRRVVVRLNAAAAAGQNVYGLNQFGDLTNEEVQERCYPEMEDRELITRCQAAVPVPDPGPDPVHGRLFRYQIKDTVTNMQSIVRKRLLLESEVDRKVCQCIARELKQTESGGSAIPGDDPDPHMWI